MFVAPYSMVRKNHQPIFPKSVLALSLAVVISLLAYSGVRAATQRNLQAEPPSLSSTEVADPLAVQMPTSTPVAPPNARHTPAATSTPVPPIIIPSAEIMSNTRPPAPTPLSPPHQSHTTNPFPTFAWTSVSGAVNYRIMVYDHKRVSERTVDIRQNSAVSSIQLNGPLQSGRYFWRMRAWVQGVWSRWSNRFTLWVDDDVPATNGPYYVSKNGNNRNGLSWATAWTELNQINWSVIQPGAVIYLDGGTSQMTYTTDLQIGRSGLPNLPITIRASRETGRSGSVIFFGGRNKPLPYCGQQSYQNQADNTMREYGIRTNDHQHIVIDGMHWGGILIQGYRISGIRIDHNSSNIMVRNVEITNNGDAEPTSEGWQSDHPGVRLGGRNVTFQRVIIHDNGQDAFQSLWGDNNIKNFRLEQSWLYNGRQHPTVDESANYCTHTDGIQLYDGGNITGVTITESVIGPGFTQGIMLGQTRTSNGSWAAVQNVTLRDVLFTKGADNNVVGYRETASSNWVIDRVTVHCPKTKYNCIHLNNSNHMVTNSVFVDGYLNFPDGLDTFYGNCRWNTSGLQLGGVVNPNFANVSETDHFSLDNYTVDPATRCQGSRITSVAQLLKLR